jgi:cold-inducible RNA-binding protein
MKTIFVGNVSFQSTEENLRSAFAAFGTVNDVRIVRDQETGRSRGFGFVEMEDDKETAAAIGQMNGRELDGRQLNVSEARPKPDRTPRYSQGIRRYAA